MKKVEIAVPYLTRNAYGDIEIVRAKYNGAIPKSVFASFTKYVKRLGERGVFYPVDTMDVYHAAYAQLEKAAANLHKGIESKEAYLRSTARLAVLKVRKRLTLKRREEYRQLEGAMRPAEENGVSCDQEMDASCSDDERVSYDANDLAEMLIAAPDRNTMRRQAVDCLERTFAKLNPQTVRAFRAWIASVGVVKEAASLCGEERTKYHRLWDKRRAEFRAACDWIGF